MAVKILAEFILTGINFNPEEITSFLGIAPTKTWRLGDQIQTSLLTYKHDGWLLSTGEEESLDLNNQLRSVIDQLKPHFSKIKEVCARLNLEAEIGFAVYVENGETPALHFDKDIVQIAADLNAEIDIDLYVFSSSEEDSKSE
jgi:hypothetical protein